MKPAWHEISLEPSLRRPSRVSGAELEERLAAGARFRELALPHLAWTREALSELSPVVWMVDAEGLVLWAEGDEAARRDAEAEPGCCWAEAVSGANAAGRALCEDGPVLSRPCAGGAAWQAYASLAAPVRGPAGRRAGAVVVSTSGAADADRMKLILFAARAVEREWQGQRARLEGDGRIRRFLDEAPDALLVAGEDGTVVLANDRLEALLGWREDELMGRPLDVLLPERLRALYAERRGRYREDPRAIVVGRELDVGVLRKDGGEVPVEIGLSPVRTREGVLVFASVRDVSRQREARRRLEIRDSVSRALAECGTFEEAARRILERVARELGCEAGSVWLVDGRDLRFVHGWFHPEIEGSDFARLTRTIPYERGKGLPGIVWEIAHPILLQDLREPRGYLRVDSAIEAGLRSALGFPIVLEREVLGVFDFVSRGRLEADEETLQMLSSLGIQTGLFIERRRAEQQRNASVAKLEHLLREMPMSLWTTDCGLSVTYAAGRAKLPWRTGMSIPDLLPPGHPAVAGHREALQGGSGRFTVESGDCVYRVAVEPLRDERDEILGTIGAASDVTVLQRAEARLEEAEQIAHAGSWDWDVKRDLVTWSPGLFRLYGVEPGGFRGTFSSYLERVHPEDRERVRRAVEQAAAERKPFAHEYRIVRPDGATLVVHARAEPRTDAEGRVVRLLGSCQDVTERKRAEDEVRRLNAGLEAAVRERTAELEGALQEMGSFSHAVAHDLRAPLRSMHGLGEILLQEYPGRALDARGADYLRRIQAAARRMDALLQDLLAYGRLARAEIPLEPLPVAEVAKDVVDRFSGELRERRGEVAVAASPDLAQANRGLLEQALANLLSNALKFVLRGVEPRVRIAVERRDGRVRVSVADNGIGIAPEHHERIFGVFQQLHSRADYPGTGIGLALTRRAVERMGGRMGLESAPGRGSTFWFELPAVSGSAAGSGS